jgi:hypothetical protein
MAPVIEPVMAAVMIVVHSMLRKATPGVKSVTLYDGIPYSSYLAKKNVARQGVLNINKENEQ